MVRAGVKVRATIGVRLNLSLSLSLTLTLTQTLTPTLTLTLRYLESVSPAKAAASQPTDAAQPISPRGLAARLGLGLGDRVS